MVVVLVVIHLPIVVVVLVVIHLPTVVVVLVVIHLPIAVVVLVVILVERPIIVLLTTVIPVLVELAIPTSKPAMVKTHLVPVGKSHLEGHLAFEEILGQEDVGLIRHRLRLKDDPTLRRAVHLDPSVTG